MAKFALNGWQRLWVLIGVIYACAVAAFSFINFPNKLTISEYLGSSNVELGNFIPTEPVYYVLIKEKWIKVDHTAKHKNKDQCIYLRDNEWSEPISCEDFYRVDLPREFNESDRRTLTLKRAKFIGGTVLFWAIPLVALYIFGAVVGWVIIGFRKK